jgi:hypothetical protein
MMQAAQMEPDDLIEIRTFAFRHEAEFAASVLEAAGIESMVRDGYFAGIDPAVMFTYGGVPLFVRAREAEQALTVLASVAEVENAPDVSDSEEE